MNIYLTNDYQRDVWVIEGYENIAFKTWEDAYIYDIQHNPEFHITKEKSLYRYEHTLYCVKYKDLNTTQRLYLD